MQPNVYISIIRIMFVIEQLKTIIMASNCAITNHRLHMKANRIYIITCKYMCKRVEHNKPNIMALETRPGGNKNNKTYINTAQD